MPLPSQSLSVLDVGHGNSTVIHTQENTVIIDAGPGSSLLEFLELEGIEEIDLVLISHADQDHIAGLMALLSSDTVNVRKVRANTDSLKNSAIWDDLVFELSCNTDIDYRPSLVSEQTGEFDFDCIKIQVLAPSAYIASKGPGSTDRSSRTISTNSISAVFRLLNNERPIAVIPGDIDSVGLDNMNITSVQIEAPILIFPHHGGRLGSEKQTAALAEKITKLVSPNTVVFSIGRGKNKTPRGEVVAAIKQHSGTVRMLCTQLSKNCSKILPEIEPVHLSDTYACGRRSRKCCAGTIVIDIGNPTVISPSYNEHQQFISESVENPLCKQ